MLLNLGKTQDTAVLICTYTQSQLRAIRSDERSMPCLSPSNERLVELIQHDQAPGLTSAMLQMLKRVGLLSMARERHSERRRSVWV